MNNRFVVIRHQLVGNLAVARSTSPFPYNDLTPRVSNTKDRDITGSYTSRMGTLLRNALFLLVALAIYAYQPTKQRLVTLGLTRGSIIENVHGFSKELRVIEDTRHCEDLHYWEASNGRGMLFTACEGRGSRRTKWFPPMTVFDDPELGSGDMTGSIHVLDPEVSLVCFLVLDIPLDPILKKSVPGLKPRSSLSYRPSLPPVSN